jgi:AcrR family transcriptional regulator
MKYLDDVTEHSQRQSLQKRIEIIKFFENYGMEAYNPLTTNQAIVTMLINQAIDSLEEQFLAKRLYPNDNTNSKANYESRRLQILRNSIKLFVKKGYNKTTVRNIARQNGITVGTLYHYFSSKKEILHQFVLLWTEAERSVVERPEFAHMKPSEALRKQIKIYYKSIDRHEDMVLFLNREMPAIERRDQELFFENSRRTISYFEKVLRRGIEAGEFVLDDPLLMAHNIVLMFHIWATKSWHLREHWNSVDEYADAQVDAILKAITVKRTYEPVILNCG